MGMSATKDKSATQFIKPIILVVIVVVLVLVPSFGVDYAMSVMTRIFLYMALGQMWNLLAGYAGLASLGNQIFVGLGGYCLAMVTEKFGLPVILSLPVTIIVTVVVAFVMSFPIFKMKGVYFTIGTWIVAEAISVFFTNWAFVNYANGFTVTATYSISPNLLYWLSLAVGLGSIALVFGLLRSPIGLGLMSCRDNEAAAEVRGVKIRRTKLICFLIAAAFTGIAGILLFTVDPYIKPSSGFTINWSVSMVFIVVIGGMGTIEGPIIGALVYIVLRQALYNFPGISMTLLGIIAVAVILLLPKGIMGTLHDKFGWEVFSVRRRVKGLPPTGVNLKDLLK